MVQGFACVLHLQAGPDVEETLEVKGGDQLLSLKEHVRMTMGMIRSASLNLNETATGTVYSVMAVVQSLLFTPAVCCDRPYLYAM